MANDKYALAPWMKVAESYLGVTEISGAEDNPVIVKFFRNAGHPEIKDDETAWCSAFANAVMFESNIRGTNNLMARSWLNWEDGEKVVTPRFGDIVVFKRGNSNVYGHVAFFESWDSNFVYVLGGNQGVGQVNRTRIPRANLLGFRRPAESAKMNPQVPKMTTKREVRVRPEDLIAGGAGAVAATQSPVGLIVFFIILAVVGYVIWRRS